MNLRKTAKLIKERRVYRSTEIGPSRAFPSETLTTIRSRKTYRRSSLSDVYNTGAKAPSQLRPRLRLVSLDKFASRAKKPKLMHEHWTRPISRQIYWIVVDRVRDLRTTPSGPVHVIVKIKPSE